MKKMNNQRVVRPGMYIFTMTTIPNPDPREPSPDLNESGDDFFTADEDDQVTDTNNPNTNLSGIKDDRTHDPEEAQAEQEEKDDEDKPNLSGNINV